MHRTIPRDFFNEAKLLKCLGRFHLQIENNPRIKFDFDGEAFEIKQNESDGSLYCANYHIFIDGVFVDLFTPYNSKENWPLIIRIHDSEFYVFDENGKPMPTFMFFKS